MRVCTQGCFLDVGAARTPPHQANISLLVKPLVPGWLREINFHQAGDDKTPSGENVRPQESLPGAGLMASWQAEPQGRSASCWQPATPALAPINASALCYSESKRPEIYFYNTVLALHGGIKRRSTSKTTRACTNHYLYPPEQSGAWEQVLCKRLKRVGDLGASSSARDTPTAGNGADKAMEGVPAEVPWQHQAAAPPAFLTPGCRCPSADAQRGAAAGGWGTVPPPHAAPAPRPGCPASHQPRRGARPRDSSPGEAQTNTIFPGGFIADPTRLGSALNSGLIPVMDEARAPSLQPPGLLPTQALLRNGDGG